jgi:hypothetical protein
MWGSLHVQKLITESYGHADRNSAQNREQLPRERDFKCPEKTPREFIIFTIHIRDT